LLGNLLRNATGRGKEDFVPRGGKAGVKREARIFLALYFLAIGGSLWGGNAALLWAWLLPLVIGQPFLRAFLLAEHAGCPQTPDMLRNSRTTETNGFLRWLGWNMSFHAEHHAYPAVPFHKLARLHGFTRPHLGSLQKGYLAFHRAYLARLAR
jgi:fatty acid desaturase